MLSVDDIEAIADGLTPAMIHVVGRCSDAGFWGDEPTCCWREWRDVVSGRPHCSFRHSVCALARRGVVALKDDIPGMATMVALTRTGLRVQAALRLRGLI